MTQRAPASSHDLGRRSASLDSPQGVQAPLERRRTGRDPSTQASTDAQSSGPVVDMFNDAVGAGLHDRISRAADGGGISSGWSGSVARASESSGSALPGPLKSTFESSLGVDLSGVRVHTGGSSAQAAGAVGAKAYALGQDIHFGAGQYDPSSSGGKHLIAHEVAHTVQQRGASTGAQFKLEISTPGDSCEVEADRAADAMVRGAPTSVSSGGVQLGRVIMRTPSTDLAAAADRGEDDGRAAVAAAPPEVTTVTNVQDVAQAQRLYNEIEHDLPLLQQGNETGNTWMSTMGVPNSLVTDDQITATEDTRTALSTFLASAGEQARELSDFQRQCQQCVVDYGRIQGMMDQFQSAHPEVAGATTASGASAMGDSVVRAAGGRSVAESGRAARAIPHGPGGGVFATEFNDFRERRSDLEAVSGEITTCQHNASSQSHTLLEAIDALQAGPTTRVEAGSAARSELSSVRAQCERVKSWVRTATSAAATRAATAMTAAGAPAAVSAAAGHVGTATDFFVDGAYAGQINTLQTAVDEAEERAASHARDAQMRAVRAAMEAWHANLVRLMSAIDRLRGLRNELRTSTDLTSGAADASGHGDIAVIIRFTGECDEFLAQVRTTIGLGEAEQAAATYATGDRDAAGALTYYAALQTYSLGEITYQAQARHAVISEGYSTGSTEGDHGVNPAVNRALTELRGMESLVSAFHGRLSIAAGIGNTTPGASTMAPDPSMRSATGDPPVLAH